MSFYIFQLFLFIVYSVIFGFCKFKSNRLYGWVVTIHLTLVMGLRSELVGTDTGQYVGYYEKQIDENVFFYDGLSRLVHLFWGNNYRFFLLIISFLTVSLIVGVLVRMVKNFNMLFLSIYIYITFYFYLDGFNIQRQLLAVSFVFLSFFWLEKKHYTLSIIVLICAIGIHNTALVMLIMFPIHFLKISRARLVILMILTIIGNEFLLIFLKYFSNLFNHYSMYTNPINANAYSASGGSALVGIFLLVVALLVAWLEPDLPNEANRITIALVLVGSVLYVVSAHSQLVVRIGEYFVIFSIFLIPTSITLISQKFVEKRIVFYLLYSSTLLLGMLIFLYKLSQNYGEVVPYVLS